MTSVLDSNVNPFGYLRNHRKPRAFNPTVARPGFLDFKRNLSKENLQPKPFFRQLGTQIGMALIAFFVIFFLVKPIVFPSMKQTSPPLKTEQVNLTAPITKEKPAEKKVIKTPKIKKEKVFSEKEMSTLNIEMKSALQQSREIEEVESENKVEKESAEEMDNGGVNESQKESRTLLENFVKIVNVAERLRMAVENIETVRKQIDRKQKAIEMVKEKIVKSKNALIEQSALVEKDSKDLSKLQEERLKIKEQLSDSRILLENTRKSVQKQTENKSALSLELEVNQRDSQRHRQDVNSQRKSLEKLTADVSAAGEKLINAESLNAENKRRKKELKKKEKDLLSQKKSFDSNLTLLSTQIQKIDFNKKEIEMTLTTIKNFDHLLENVKTEINGHSAELNKSSLEMNERERKQKAEERRIVLKRIRTFQQNAVESLREMFKLKESDFDKLKEILLGELSKISGERNRLEERLEIMKNKRNLIEKTLKNIRMEINHFFEISINEKKRDLERKKELVETSKENLKRVEKDEITARKKMEKIKIELTKEKTKLDEMVREEKLNNSDLERKETELKEIERKLKNSFGNWTDRLSRFKAKRIIFSEEEKRFGDLGSDLRGLRKEMQEAIRRMESSRDQLGEFLYFKPNKSI